MNPDSRQNDSPRPARPALDGVEVARTVGGFLVGRLRYFTGVALLAFAAPLLVLAWRTFSGVLGEKDLAASLRGRGSAQVVAAYWHLTVHDEAARGSGALELLGNDVSTAWAVLEPDAASRAAGVPARLAYRLGDAPPLAIHYVQGIDTRVGSRLRPAWSDESGLWPRVEIRIPRPIAERLAKTPAEPWVIQYADEELAAAEPSGSELEAFRIQLDEPWDAVTALWLRPPSPAAIPLAFDPVEPAHALPLADLEALRGKPRWPMLIPGVMFAGFGLGLYFVASTALLAGFRRLGPPIALAILVALPWWGDWVTRFIEWSDADLGRFVRELSASKLDELLADRLPQSEPAGETLRLVYEPQRGYFAELLAPFSSVRPTPPPVDANAAWRALTDAIATQMLALPVETQRTLLQRLVLDERRDHRKAGEAFVPAAERLTREGADENLRDWARSFLLYRLRAVNDPGDHRADFAAQMEIRERLTRHADPVVAARAAASLARIAEWRKRIGSG